LADPSARSLEGCRVVRATITGPGRWRLIQPSIRAHPCAQHQFGPGRASLTGRPPRGQL